MAKRNPYKEHEFKRYLLWKSLPFRLKGKNISEYELMGISDEEELELLSIKYAKDFQKKYKVGINTTTQWNKKIESDYSLWKEYKKWASKYTQNLFNSLYRQGLAEGDPARIREWMKYIMDFQDSIRVESESARKKFDLFKELQTKK